MTSEPEIVKILREEERSKQSLADSSYKTKKTSTSDNPLLEKSDDSTVLLSNLETQCGSLSPDQLAVVYRNTFETCLLAILVLDTQKRIISWNASVETLLRKTKVELYLQSVGSLHPTNEWSRLEKTFEHQLGLQHQIETKILVKNQNLLDVAVSLSNVKNNDGNSLGYLYIIKNISEQKQSEKHLRSIIQYCDDSMYILNDHSQYLMVNNSFLSRHGCTREEVLGKRYSDFHSTEEAKEFTRKLSWVLEHGLPLEDLYCKQENWFIRTIYPVKDTTTSQIHEVLVISKDITENKKTQNLLWEKQNLHRMMFESFPHAILLIDKDGTVLDTNEAITDWSACSPNQMKGMNLLNLPLLTKESKKTIKKIFIKGKSTKKIAPVEIDVLSKQDDLQKATLYISPLVNQQADIFGYVIILTNSTSPRYTKEIIKRKDPLIDSVRCPITLIDLDGKITYANDSFIQLWGYTDKNDVIDKPIEKFWNTNEQYSEIIQTLQNKEQWVGNINALRKDHTTFQTQLYANTLKNKSDQSISIMGFYIDTNQNITNIDAKNESEKKFQVVLENSLDMIYQFNLKTHTCDYVSPSSQKIIGYTPKEIISNPIKKIGEFIHQEDSVRWIQHLEQVTSHPMKENAVQSIEYRFNHKTRGYRWMRDTFTTLFNDENEPEYVVGSIEDITDRKKVWEELVKSEEKYRILAETSADGVFTTDSLGRLTYVNPSFEKLCGRRKSQILATPFRNYLLEDSVYFFQQIFIDVRKKNDKIENVELELVSGNGDITPIEVNIAPLTKQTEFGGVVCTVRDITQRREIEDELKKNERLKTEFMNIAAHELRSPVTPIKGYLDLIIHDNESNEKIKNWAKISLRNAERLLKLVNDILDVARLDSDTMRFDMEKIDPVEFLNEIVEDMKPAVLNKKLEFHVNIPTQLPHIIGDKIRLSQVLKNLIGNSLKFTDCGFIGLDVEKKDNYILVAVVDTGIGISQDELRKIFTKFYQAYTGEDRNNEGTGLGLFISKEIVKKHNGTIWAESEVGKGSRFIIQLPYIYKMTVDFKT